MTEQRRAEQRVLEDVLVFAGDVAPWMAERLVPQIIDALRALPVEQRMEAMGMTPIGGPLVRVHGSDEPLQAWVER